MKYIIPLMIVLFLPIVYSSVTDNIIFYHALDDSDLVAGVFNDSAGNINATNTGTTSATGKLNQARNFTGAGNDYISVADNAILDSTGDITVSGWVKHSTGTNDGSNDEYIIERWGSAPSNSWQLRYTLLDKIQFIVDTGASSCTATSGITLNNTDWHFIMGIYGGGTCKIYIDGTSQGSQTVGVSVENNNADITIGNYNGGSCGSDCVFEGLIDEAAYWDKALNSTERDNLYNGGSGSNPYGAVLTPYITNISVYQSSVYTEPDVSLNFTPFNPAGTIVNVTVESYRVRDGVYTLLDIFWVKYHVYLGLGDDYSDSIIYETFTDIKNGDIYFMQLLINDSVNYQYYNTSNVTIANTIDVVSNLSDIDSVFTNFSIDIDAQNLIGSLTCGVHTNSSRLNCTNITGEGISICGITNERMYEYVNLTPFCTNGTQWNDTDKAILATNIRNITFYAYNDWNGSILKNINATLTNTSGAWNYTSTDGNLTFEYGWGGTSQTCGYTNITVNVSDHMNNYTYQSYGCNLNDNYNLSFYQAVVNVTALNSFDNSPIANSNISINDSSIMKSVISAPGYYTFYVNNATYDMYSTNPSPFFSDSARNVTFFLSGTNTTINTFMSFNASATFYLYDANNLTLITDNITIDIYNAEQGFSDTITTPTGTNTSNNLPEGLLRVTAYGDDWDTVTVYQLISSNQITYTINLYLTSSTDSDVKDVLLHVSDEADLSLEGADIRVYALNTSSGNFYLVTNKYTNINGESLATLILDTVFYKFSIYYLGTKCYETSPNSEFTIGATDDNIYFKCIIDETYITQRDIYSGANVTLGAINTSNLTGYFTLEGSSNVNTDFCLDVYRTVGRNEDFVATTCVNSTSALFNYNVSASGYTKDVTYRAVAKYYPEGGTGYKVGVINYLNFNIVVKPSFGSMGLFLTIIVMIVISFSLFNYPSLAALSAGIIFFGSTLAGIADIPKYGHGTEVGAGITFLILSIIIAFAVSKRGGE